MIARVIQDFTDPETGNTFKAGSILDGREARLAVNAGKAERYSARQRLQDAQKLILTGAVLGTKKRSN